MARQYEKVTYDILQKQKKDTALNRAVLATIAFFVFAALPFWININPLFIFIVGAIFPSYFYGKVIQIYFTQIAIDNERKDEQERRQGAPVLGMPPQRDCFKVALQEARAKGKKIIGKYLVGFSLDTGEPLWVSDTDMCGHGCVFAKTGGGKTLWFESIMLQQMARGRASGFTFIDAKRDSGVLAEIILMALITGRIEDLIVIDPFNTLHSYNFVLTNQRSDVKARKILRASLPPTSDQSATKHYDRLASDSIGRMIRAMESFGLAWSIRDVAAALSQFPIAYPHLKEMLEKIGAKEAVVELGHLATSYRNVKGELDTQKINDNLRGVSSELHSIGGSSMGKIFCTNYTDLNLTDAIVRGKIIYFMLPRLEDAESAARMVKLFREDLEVSIGEVTSSRQWNLEDPHLVIIDEGSSTFGPTWANLFELARKGRFSLLFGAQSTGGLQDTSLGLSRAFYERVMANVNLKVMMRLGDNQTASDMAEWIGKVNTVKRSIGSGVSSSVVSTGFGLKETGGESQNFSLQEAETDLVSSEELKHEMSAEKGLAYFDLGNGEIVKGRSFWFNADLPPTWEGREYVHKFEKIESDELGLSDWVDETIYSTVHSNEVEKKGGDRQPSKRVSGKNERSKESSKKKEESDDLLELKKEIEKIKAQYEDKKEKNVASVISPTLKLNSNKPKPQREKLNFGEKKPSIVEEPQEEPKEEALVEEEKKEEPKQFKLSSSPKRRIRGAVIKLSRPKK